MLLNGKKKNRYPASEHSAYAKAGVNIRNGDTLVKRIAPMVQATYGKEVKSVPSGYAGLFEINKDQYLAATTDGVGTKLKLAFDLGIHHTVGIDLVAMSVNDLICVGARPLFFLDYFATGKLKVSIAAKVIEGMTAACRETGVALIAGETAEMPGFYASGEYDLGGFAVGMVHKNDLITGKNIRPGDLLIGIESSGLHSNGFSLVRKLIVNKTKADRTLLKKCLTPTALYVNFACALQKKKIPLNGLLHITGGGLLNIPRANENFDYLIRADHYPKGNPQSNIFSILERRGQLSAKDLFTTFNMGIGFVVVARAKHANAVLRMAQQHKLGAHIIGLVKKKTSALKSPKILVQGRGYDLVLRDHD